MTQPIRLGTRGSPLALHQAALTSAALRATLPDLEAPEAIEVVVVRTTGDRITDRPLAEVGGKALFCKEIETALAERRIDVAVHSMKDLPTWLPDGLVLAGVLERADVRDVLISKPGADLQGLPESALIGTTSPRRQAQLMAQRPDLRVGLLRGNVQTRLARIEEGVVDATLLAKAGLDRLGIGVSGVVLDAEQMLPACGQGLIALECRADDERMRMVLEAIEHRPSACQARGERALLEAIDGSCHTPLGGLAELIGAELFVRGLLAWPDGSRLLRAERRGPAADASRLGREVGEELRASAGPDYPAYG
jgi:hydroxymethylbilane synthase